MRNVKKATYAAVIAIISGISSSASAEIGLGAWHHAFAPMGQQEGLFTNSDRKSAINYGCGGSYSNLRVSVKDRNVSGASVLKVDGKAVLEVPIAYEPASKASLIRSEVSYDNPARVIKRHNAVMMALAKGNAATLELPDGSQVSFSLKGSKKIKGCTLFVN